MKIGSKRRRSKQQIADEKDEAMIKQQAIDDKLAKMEKLQAELADAQQQILDNQSASELVTNMIDQGFVKMNQEGVMVPGDAVNLN